MNTTVAQTWISNPDAYRRKLLGLVGDRNPLDIMAQTADSLMDIVNRHTTAQMRTRPFEGKWTPNEVIGHLTDSEWVYGYRMRLILSEDEPTILGMDQDRWVAAQRLNEREPRELVEMFRALRKFNLAVWKQLTPDDNKRFGNHNERGKESLGDLLPMMAGHDLSHVDQIKRYLEAVKQAGY
jgi:DinB superfamily